jgi:hypothetical protein
METAIKAPEGAVKTGRSLRAAFTAFVTVLLLGASFPSGAANFVEREYADAVRSFKSGRTSEAFGQFIDLANRGDVDSARIALFMHTYGAVLFNKQWDAGPQDVAYWNSLVRNSANSGRPPMEFQPTVLVPGKARPKAAPAKARPAPAANLLVSAD